MSPCALGVLVSLLAWKTPLNPSLSFDIAPIFKWVLFWLVLSVTFEAGALVFRKSHGSMLPRIAKTLFTAWVVYVAACGVTLAALTLTPETWGTSVSITLMGICCITFLWANLAAVRNEKCNGK